ncbi:MAG: radical SAM protein [Zestosphaera sp.]
MRVALVLAGEGSVYGSSFGFTVPPLAAAYLAAVTVERGADVRFFDSVARQQDLRTLALEVTSYDPDMVGFLMNTSASHKASVGLGRVLKRVCGSLIIAGGHHATFTYPILLREGFDVVVLGEGEETFSELLKVYAEGASFREVRGLTYMDGGEVRVTKPRSPVEDLNRLPLPRYDVFDRALYRAGLLDPHASVAPLETSRGCPYNCEYCSATRMWGRSWRFKIAERVVEELKTIYRLRYRWVFIVDDNFIIPVKKVLEEKLRLLDMIAGSYLSRLRYIIQVRADLIARNKWIVRRLRDAGVRVVFLGLESGDPGTLKKMRKGSSTDVGVEAVKSLVSEGMIVHAGFILGAPYEGRKGMRKTLTYAYGLAEYLDSAQFSIYTPLPGTDSFVKALREGSLLTLDWSLYDVHTPVMKTYMDPVELFIRDRLAYYTFFLIKSVKHFKNALRRGIRRTRHREKDTYIGNAVKYVVRHLPLYLNWLVKLPEEAFRVKKALKKGVDQATLELLRRLYVANHIAALKNLPSGQSSV